MHMYHMYIYTCVHVDVHMCACPCARQRTALAIIHQMASSLLRQGFSLAWNLPSKLGWAGPQAQG